MTKDNELFGHPKGLFVLFFTEMWERFSYYGMRAILVLYIISETTGDNPGLGWSNGEALALYGWYTMMVYVMSIPGGILADKFLGQKKTVMLGGLLLCLGHGVLAIENIWAFYTGLTLIVLGVGGLKPNISTMVGGLYPAGDVRRDKGFTIFYIGINLGAFLSSLIVGYIGEEIGWHYGFALAGIGMILGQIVYMFGQKYLIGVGDLVKVDPKSGDVDKPLTKIEKDRIVVMLLSFIIIVVFWGAFEQAGGLMNIYTMEKIDRSIFGLEIPASVFQSVNAFFIIIFGTSVAGFWAKRQLNGKESSTLFKMATGTMIMGLGFLLMTFAAQEVDSAYGTKAAMYWLIGAYLLHTIGELFASPNALSFVTKLAPAKYASIMMGLYFAATGFGSKLAGTIGEMSQVETIEVAYSGTEKDIINYVSDTTFSKKLAFELKSTIKVLDSTIEFNSIVDQKNTASLFDISKESIVKIKESMEDLDNVSEFHSTIKLKFEEIILSAESTDSSEDLSSNQKYLSMCCNDCIEHIQNGSSIRTYTIKGQFIVDEVQNRREFMTFTGIFLFTLAFGLLLMIFIKKLKALTHGAEDLETDLA